MSEVSLTSGWDFHETLSFKMKAYAVQFINFITNGAMDLLGNKLWSRVSCGCCALSNSLVL